MPTLKLLHALTLSAAVLAHIHNPSAHTHNLRDVGDVNEHANSDMVQPPLCYRGECPHNAQPPAPEKRDDSSDPCSMAKQSCGLGVWCACDISDRCGSSDGSKDAAAELVQCLADYAGSQNGKREEEPQEFDMRAWKSIVSEGRDLTTTIFEDDDIVLVQSVVQSSPRVVVDKIEVSDTSAVVTASMLADGAAMVLNHAMTYSDPQETGDIERRGENTVTITASILPRSQRPSEDPFKEIGKGLYDDGPSKREATVAYVDKRSGHEILNPEVVTQSSRSTTQVTIVNVHGDKETVSAHEDSHGRTVLDTQAPSDTAVTVTVSIHDSTTSTIHPTISTSVASTETLRVINLGSTTETLTPTTNKEGKVVFVTRMGNYASSTTTVRFIEPEDTTTCSKSKCKNRHETRWTAPTSSQSTASSAATVTAYVTRTVTAPARSQCCGCGGCHKNACGPTVVNANGTWITMTASLQRLANGTKAVIAPSSQGTLIPLMWDESYGAGWEPIMDMDLGTSRSMFPDADWQAIILTASDMRKHNSGMEEEPSIKLALIMHLRGSGEDPSQSHSGSASSSCASDHFARLSKDGPSAATKTVAVINGTTIPIAHSMQKINGLNVAVDPLLKYKLYDPRHHAVAPTGTCEKKHKNSTQWMDCYVEQCMWNMMKPINITTVLPARMIDNCGKPVVSDYFTQRTSVKTVHWGTQNTNGQFYPTEMTCLQDLNGTKTQQPVRVTPAWMGQRHKARHHVHGDPPCYDPETCFDYCSVNSTPEWDPKIKLATMILVPIAAFLALMTLLCCCCWCWRRHRRRRGEKDMKSVTSITEKIKRVAKGQPTETIVTNEVTRTAIDPATGRAVDPGMATAITAGTAAGAAAASERGAQSSQAGSGDGGQFTTITTAGGNDGRGTTARRAEEGRGRVRFGEGGTGGNAGANRDATTTTTTTVQDGQPQTQTQMQTETETVPVAQQDGALGLPTGMQIADMGSMRGRKRMRPEGALGLNLGF